MAQDIGFDIATSGPSITLLTTSLATGALSALTALADFGTPSPIEIGYTLKLDCQASATGYAYLKAYWSQNSADFTSSDPDNGEVVAVTLCKASTVVCKVGTFPLRARHVKLAIDNQSGGIIWSAGSSIAVVDLFGDQV
jgi:hypothetical protein